MRQETSTSCAVSLRRLLPQASFSGCSDLCVRDATERSCDVQPESLFAVIRGSKVDGRQFVSEAVSRGAAGLLIDAPIPNCSLPQCVVAQVRPAFSAICQAIEGQPSHRMKIAGVTGTNGKTTTTYLIRSLLERASRRCGLLGTIEYSDGLRVEPSSLTTPDSRSISRWFSRMWHAGAEHAAMEVSSHALHQGRAAGVDLEAAVITNITHDHFDYHRTFEQYLEAKSRIVEMVRSNGIVAINADDAGAGQLRERALASRRCVTFGLTTAADVMAQIRDESLSGTRFRLSLHGRSLDCATRLIGRHNVSNILAAVTVAAHFGIADDVIVSGIEAMRHVPGRLEQVDCGQPFHVFVDYAHTDDALRRCLMSLRSLTSGRLICVFGAGGDRDRSKRPKLGKAALLADVAILTSDNPRSESPEAIIDEILIGMKSAPVPPFVEVDRRRAIQRALGMARPGDCIIIAGKGHENEQIIGRERFPFDDRQLAQEILRERWQPLGLSSVRASA